MQAVRLKFPGFRGHRSRVETTSRTLRSPVVSQHIRRARLESVLARRHDVDLIALESPAGFGRTVLIEQCVPGADGYDAGRVDFFVKCRREHAIPGRLAGDLLRLLDGEERPAGRGLGDDHMPSDEEAVGLVEAAAKRFGVSVAVVFDDVQLARPGGWGFLSAWLDHPDRRAHLVMSGRALPDLGLARLVASGRAIHLGAPDLHFDAAEIDEYVARNRIGPLDDVEVASWPALLALEACGTGGLVPGYLAGQVLADLAPEVSTAFCAVSYVGGCSTERLPSFLTRLFAGEADDTSVLRGGDLDEIIARLVDMPLTVSSEGLWPHPVWRASSTRLLSKARREAAIRARLAGKPSPAALVELGDLAVQGGLGDSLAGVVCEALEAEPPRVPLACLKTWMASGVLDETGPQFAWLAGVVAVRSGDPPLLASRLLESARSSFRSVGHLDAELGVIFNLGTVYRRAGDIRGLGVLLERAEEIWSETAKAEALALVCIGRAVTAQLKGDSPTAVAELAAIPAGSLQGDWLAQVDMIRGTNLLLSGHVDESIRSLESAATSPTPAIASVAYDLLASARWVKGRRAEAIADARRAVSLAAQDGSRLAGLLTHANLALMLAADGETLEATSLADLPDLTGGMPEGEPSARVMIAKALLAIESGDNERARSVLSVAGQWSARPVLSSLWAASLETALLPERRAIWDDLARRTPGFAAPVEAGRLAVRYLDAGRPVPIAQGTFVPRCWCEPSAPTLEVRVLGSFEVWHGRSRSTHQAWKRVRVRELLAYLVLAEDPSRAKAAAALWPDLDERSAMNNLRVTLSYLLDGLEPDRLPHARPSVLTEVDGKLQLGGAAALRVDIWDARSAIAAILNADDTDARSIRAAGRRLVESWGGPLVSDASFGDWIEPSRWYLNQQGLRACLKAATASLSGGDLRQVERLSELATTLDPWSDRAYELLARAQLAGGDRDAARLTLTRLVDVLSQGGSNPGAEIYALARRSGLRLAPWPPRIPSRKA